MKKSMSVFDRRINYKPYDYPEVIGYVDAINQSFWTVKEWNFTSDIQDFKVNLNDKERNVLKNCMLAIAQIEVAVKKYWSRLGDKFPRPEFEAVGVTFGESEQRHAASYAHLLEILGFNDEFEKLVENPVIKGRINYLSKYLKPEDNTNEAFTKSLTLFSIFTENVSLFSQFLIMKSFNKYKNTFKDVDNLIMATQKEENLHAQFGIWLTNQIKKENPEWFNDEFYKKIDTAAKKAFKAESAIIDWIFEDGDLPFINAYQAKEFVKSRLNDSVKSIGGTEIYKPDPAVIKELKWFDEEIYGTNVVDFFHKRGSYASRDQSFSENDLF